MKQHLGIDIVLSSIESEAYQGEVDAGLAALRGSPHPEEHQARAVEAFDQAHLPGVLLSQAAQAQRERLALPGPRRHLVQILHQLHCLVVIGLPLGRRQELRDGPPAAVARPGPVGRLSVLEASQQLRPEVRIEPARAPAGGDGHRVGGRRSVAT